MARRKSLVAHLISEYQKNKRENQRLAIQQSRQYQRDRQQQLAAQEKEQRRQQAAWEAEAAERRKAEAEERTAAIRRREEELDRVLVDRDRGWPGGGSDLERVFAESGSDGFADAVGRRLARIRLPDGLEVRASAVYRPEARELWLEYELPGQNHIPTVTAYRYVKNRDEMVATPRREPQTKRMYATLLARLTLRILAELYDLTPASLVDGILFNGYVSAKDRATGKPIRPCLVSVNATRESFGDLVLDEPDLDPVLCLRHLNAIVSPHPYDLEPVKPVAEFDLSKYKFVEGIDVAAGLDSRLDLLTLHPTQFEHLVRELFEAIGLKSWVTQASRDDGVDGVAYNEDPVTGGLCVIQAKRYSRIVGVEAVHALAGVMNYKRAAKGILVTTSWFGKASRDFAAHTGRMQLIDGRELKYLLAEHLGLDVLISLPKVPPGWVSSDLT